MVIGGNAAGMSAASQARKRRGPDDLEIVVFERGHFTSYSSCGIPYWVGGVVNGPQALVTRAPQTFRDEYAIDVRLGREVTGIDLGRREVVVGDTRERFDQLVYAPGATPVRPDWAGAPSPWSRSCRSRCPPWIRTWARWSVRRSSAWASMCSPASR